MKVLIHTINAFAKTGNGGNPAGVALDADRLSEGQMRAIARAVGFSETAFIMRSSAAYCKMRFFTPAEEVGLCGHATIGAFSFLKRVGLLGSGRYTLETGAGVVRVEVSEDAAVMMSQRKPEFRETVDIGQIADSLNLPVWDMDAELKPQVVSTGLSDIMVPIHDRSRLDAIRPDFGKVAALSKAHGAVGYHLFTRDTLYRDTAYCRNLAPLYGIPEEAATGTSCGALACYLMKHGQLRKQDAAHLVFEQGYSMKRPSEIKVSLTIRNGEIEEVLVGGNTGDMGRETIRTCDCQD